MGANNAQRELGSISVKKRLKFSEKDEEIRTIRAFCIADMPDRLYNRYGQ